MAKKDKEKRKGLKENQTYQNNPSIVVGDDVGKKKKTRQSTLGEANMADMDLEE